MNDIVHKKITQLEVVCEDGSLYTITGVGTLHVNNTEIKTEVKGRNIPTRQAAISMSVETEKGTNGA